MQLVRSGIAVAAGFAIFSVLFGVLGPGLGAVLTTMGAGVMAGYVTAKIAPGREMLHGGATAGVVAASLVAQSALTLPARMLVAAMAIAAITAGAWVRAHARPERSAGRDQSLSDVSRESPADSSDLSRRRPQGEGGEEHL
jgi:hypothetical protein